jgi:hypothetical protein
LTRSEQPGFILESSGQTRQSLSLACILGFCGRDQLNPSNCICKDAVPLVHGPGLQISRYPSIGECKSKEWSSLCCFGRTWPHPVHPLIDQILWIFETLTVDLSTWLIPISHPPRQWIPFLSFNAACHEKIMNVLCFLRILFNTSW